MSIFNPTINNTIKPLVSVIPSTLPRIHSFQSLGKNGEYLYNLFYNSHRLLIITGAGISTESGIPDYRSPGRPAYKPLQHKDFLTSEYTRRRYWARSTIGFHRMKYAKPNTAHYALSILEKNWKDLMTLDYLQSLVSTSSNSLPSSLSSLQNIHRHIQGSTHLLITQNVDRLHQTAAQRNVLELHGTIHEVQCLKCSYTLSRTELQTILEEINKNWLMMIQQGFVPTTQTNHAESTKTKTEILVRPDGDIELPDDAYNTFQIPPCPHCNEEWLKPSVVFYGGTVPSDVTEQSMEAANTCDGVLVVGSTASTFSAFRIIRDIAKRNKPVGILNYGATRADPLANFKIEGHVGDILTTIIEESQKRISI